MTTTARRVTTVPDGDRLQGKVAFITGAARGQGRSHAVRLASEGADIAAIDIASQIETVPYPMATSSDLDETAAIVAGAGGRCVPMVADVRDIHAMDRAVKETLSALGRLDIVIANAGILPFGSGARGTETLDESSERWTDAVGVMMTGVYNTLRVVQQPMIDQGEGGSIVITSSTAGLSGMHDGSGGSAGYCAAKHGVVGLMRGYAKLLGPHGIRVNTVHPMGVATPMIVNEQFQAFHADNTDVLEVSPRRLPIVLLEPMDVSNAILWLVSDEARAVTGITLPIDAGVSCP
jgi:SDR family mycofactocin-dependent oxidoreductase